MWSKGGQNSFQMSFRLCQQRVRQDTRLRGMQEWERALPRQANFHLPSATPLQMPSHPQALVVEEAVEVMEEVLEEAALLEVAEVAVEAEAGKPTLYNITLMASSPMPSLFYRSSSSILVQTQ